MPSLLPAAPPFYRGASPSHRDSRKRESQRPATGRHPWRRRSRRVNRAMRESPQVTRWVARPPKCRELRCALPVGVCQAPSRAPRTQPRLDQSPASVAWRTASRLQPTARRPAHHGAAPHTRKRTSERDSTPRHRSGRRGPRVLSSRLVRPSPPNYSAGFLMVKQEIRKDPVRRALATLKHPENRHLKIQPPMPFSGCFPSALSRTFRYAPPEALSRGPLCPRPA